MVPSVAKFGVPAAGLKLYTSGAKTVRFVVTAGAGTWLQWVEQGNFVKPGRKNMHTQTLHCLRGAPADISVQTVQLLKAASGR